MTHMNFTITQHPGMNPVTVLHIEGRLDGSNYMTLIETAEELYQSGARNLLLDLSKLSFLSSAGISALHRVALLFQGKKMDQLEEGWAEFHAVGRDRKTGTQQHVKLLGPNEKVRGTLETVGFAQFFEIQMDAQAALGSFQQA
jgi:anti-anti-sigma factor